MLIHINIFYSILIHIDVICFIYHINILRYERLRDIFTDILSMSRNPDASVLNLLAFLVQKYEY